MTFYLRCRSRTKILICDEEGRFGATTGRLRLQRTQAGAISIREVCCWLKYHNLGRHGARHSNHYSNTCHAGKSGVFQERLKSRRVFSVPALVLTLSYQGQSFNPSRRIQYLCLTSRGYRPHLMPLTTVP